MLQRLIEVKKDKAVEEIFGKFISNQPKKNRIKKMPEKQVKKLVRV